MKNMTKPRTIAGLIGRVLRSEPGCDSLKIHIVNGVKRLVVLLSSVQAKIDLKDDVELPLLNSSRFSQIIDGTREIRYLLEWDISRVGFDKKETIKPFSFGNKDLTRRTRMAVTAQEEEVASMIGGRRHIGSGAVPGIKSDASSDHWQVEAKRTERKTFGLSIDLLSKITAEASVQDKTPMMYITFANIPHGVRMSDTWVVIPKSEYEKFNV
jgi:hypothetical protein